MTIFELRKNILASGRPIEDMTMEEAAQSLRIIRDELYDNKLQANPVMVSHMLDLAWFLSSPSARKKWEVDANKAVDVMVKEYATALGRKGGSVKSDAKAAASRENGKKGGRPKVWQNWIVGDEPENCIPIGDQTAKEHGLSDDRVVRARSAQEANDKGIKKFNKSLKK